VAVHQRFAKALKRKHQPLQKVGEDKYPGKREVAHNHKPKTS